MNQEKIKKHNMKNEFDLLSVFTLNTCISKASCTSWSVLAKYHNGFTFSYCPKVVKKIKCMEIIKISEKEVEKDES